MSPGLVVQALAPGPSCSVALSRALATRQAAHKAGRRQRDAGPAADSRPPGRLLAAKAPDCSVQPASALNWARGVKAIDYPTMFTSRHADHDTPVLQPRALRRGQPPHQLPIAPGTGQHARVAPGRWLGGERPNAVAAGNVIDASPGRHAGQAGAAIIAAAVVQIPAQRDATLLLPVRLCSEINSTW